MRFFMGLVFVASLFAFTPSAQAAWSWKSLKDACVTGVASAAKWAGDTAVARDLGRLGHALTDSMPGRMVGSGVRRVGEAIAGRRMTSELGQSMQQATLVEKSEIKVETRWKFFQGRRVLEVGDNGVLMYPSGLNKVWVYYPVAMNGGKNWVLHDAPTGLLVYQTTATPANQALVNFYREVIQPNYETKLTERFRMGMDSLGNEAREDMTSFQLKVIDDTGVVEDYNARSDRATERNFNTVQIEGRFHETETLSTYFILRIEMKGDTAEATLVIPAHTVRDAKTGFYTEVAELVYVLKKPIREFFTRDGKWKNGPIAEYLFEEAKVAVYKLNQDALKKRDSVPTKLAVFTRWKSSPENQIAPSAVKMSRAHQLGFDVSRTDVPPMKLEGKIVLVRKPHAGPPLEVIDPDAGYIYQSEVADRLVRVLESKPVPLDDRRRGGFTRHDSVARELKVQRPNGEVSVVRSERVIPIDYGLIAQGHDPITGKEIDYGVSVPEAIYVGEETRDLKPGDRVIVTYGPAVKALLDRSGPGDSAFDMPFFVDPEAASAPREPGIRPDAKAPSNELKVQKVVGLDEEAKTVTVNYAQLMPPHYHVKFKKPRAAGSIGFEDEHF